MAFITHALPGLTRSTVPRTSRFIHATSPTMLLSKGDKMPMDVDLMVLKDGAPTTVSTASIFQSKKVAVVTFPGAFTSTCQNGHVPLWIKAVDDFKAKGCDDVVALAVNDPFVMDAFANVIGNEGKVTFLADGGAKLTKAIGIEVDTDGFGGVRSYRGGYLVEDGVFTQVNLEDGTSFEGPSKPETLLAQM
ncbi:unnamed protein product [Chondrus crispus]|uniref:Thioredoxin domain-containing protein n=1 Tax=Chondrus crispus TaxID=2769 RepID=R7QBP3_CHOCR|nr:unnamed protein product [Chondrus crispus]CDF34846.1 unnamed protein product [Chondrus crispus]|eukprot:XP_005714665.1 unnamed protein product [Chondrus crispus]